MEPGGRYLDWDEATDLACRHGALTIGNFDGVHLGHQALLAELVRQAQHVGGPAVVLTFDPHPLQLLRPAQFPPLLTTMPQRAAWLRHYGADFVLMLRTTQAMLQRSAREFFERVLRDNLQPRVIVPGFNFAFGHNREGTAEKLASYCQEAGANCLQVPPARYNGETISSSRIRAALTAGDVRLAAALLGRPYALTGNVGQGARRGQTLGFPTANLHEVQTLVPADGVYAVRVHLGGMSFAGAANIGPNPTFGEGARKIEVHVIDFAGDLYGQTVTAEFVERLRETCRFATVKELVAQLHADVINAGQILSGTVK